MSFTGIQGQEGMNGSEANGSLLLSTVGAVLGASLGALAWFLLEYYANIQIGYIAIASGALAGMGAVALGKRTGVEVGTIAAAAGLAGIVLGSYSSFYFSIRGDEAREEIVAMAREMEGFDEASPAQREEAIDAIHEALIDEISYSDYAKDDVMFLLLFGGLGLFYGFRLGMGSDEEETQYVNTPDYEYDDDFMDSDQDDEAESEDAPLGSEHEVARTDQADLDSGAPDTPPGPG